MVGSLLVCCVLALGPNPNPGDVVSADADDVDTRAKALFKAGQAKYETHDYEGAISDFTAAYDLALELEESHRDEVLARLSYNLARAHVAAYDIDADTGHLEVARRLLADYRGHEREMGRDPDSDTDVERLEIDLLEREKAIQEAATHDTGEPPIDPKSDPKSKPKSDQKPRGRTQRRVGISLLAIAPAFAGMAVAGGVLGSQARDDFDSVTTGPQRLDAQQLGRTGDVLFGVGVGLAAASAIVGITLVAISRPEKNSQRLAVTLRPNGLALEGRF